MSRLLRFPSVRAAAAALFSVLLLCGSGGLRAAQGGAGTSELVILTWADYIAPEIVAAFEAEHRTRLKFVYFESDDHRDQMLTESEVRGFDIAVVNGLMLSTYARHQWLAPHRDLSISNLRHIDARWRTAFNGAEDYGVPYFWGTLGIGFRRDLVPEGFVSWREFFAPAERLRGRVTLMKSSRGLLSQMILTNLIFFMEVAWMSASLVLRRLTKKET